MSNNSSVGSFLSLDLSSRPTGVPMETVYVEVGNGMFTDYATQFLSEAWRKNPALAERVQLSVDDITRYIDYLVFKRIECVNGSCQEFRSLKTLYIPVWIAYNLSMIGKVIIRSKGLTLMPTPAVTDVIEFHEAKAISEKIAMFYDDLQIVQDAMPRSIDGDHDVMMTSLIAGYMRTIEEVAHPISTYVAAFLGFKLKEEAAFKVLYRVQYDDLEYIASALMSRKELY